MEKAEEQPDHLDVLNKGYDLDTRTDATVLGGKSIEESFQSAGENQ